MTLILSGNASYGRHFFVKDILALQKGKHYLLYVTYDEYCCLFY